MNGFDDAEKIVVYHQQYAQQASRPKGSEGGPGTRFFSE